MPSDIPVTHTSRVLSARKAASSSPVRLSYLSNKSPRINFIMLDGVYQSSAIVVNAFLIVSKIGPRERSASQRHPID
jgi:hypothetical protein